MICTSELILVLLHFWTIIIIKTDNATTNDPEVLDRFLKNLKKSNIVNVILKEGISNDDNDEDKEIIFSGEWSQHTGKESMIMLV